MKPLLNYFLFQQPTKTLTQTTLNMHIPTKHTRTPH